MRVCLMMLRVLACAALTGASCTPPAEPPAETPPAALPPLTPTPEIEPNNDPLAPQAANLAGVDGVRLVGTISPEGDVDLFDLGSMSGGHAVTVTLEPAASDANVSVVIFEVNPSKTVGTLFTVADFTTGGTAGGVLINEVFRHEGNYQLGVVGTFGKSGPGQAYDLTVRVQRGGPIPPPVGQALVLQFAGGTASTAAGQGMNILPFDPATIDAGYAGQLQAIKDAILQTVRENFRGYSVQVYSSDEHPALPAGSFSSVFFGDVSGSSPSGSEGLGMALDGVDAFNKDPADNAIVFAAGFAPAMFGSTPLDAHALGLAMGNVATHEAAHLLGLHHAYDPSEVMDTFEAPVTLLLDQRFGRALIGFAVFDTLGGFLTQDARQLLAETVGALPTQPNLTLAVGHTLLDVLAADLTGDGRPDLVTAGRTPSSLSLLVNMGGGQFQPASTIGLDGGPISVVALDADGDGHLDLLVAIPAAQKLVLLRNQGAGQFTQAATLTAGDHPRAMAVADFNGDGFPDVAVANYTSQDVVLLINDGHGNFQATPPTPVGTAPQAVAAADLNGDGRPDVVTADSGSNAISILLNTGGGVLAPAVQIPIGVLPFGLAAVDLDSDGDRDLAVANGLSSITAAQYAGEVAVLLNKGDGTFAPPATYFVGGLSQSLTAADFDGDGHPDLAVACSGHPFIPEEIGQVSVLLNCGDGTFGQDLVFQAGRGPVAAAAAGLVGGWPDLVVANRDSADVSVYFNAGPGHLGLAMPPAAGKVGGSSRDILPGFCP